MVKTNCILNGGTISNNEAIENSGGGIRTDAILVMNGGTINNNTAHITGGGVDWSSANAVFNYNAGTIEENIANGGRDAGNNTYPYVWKTEENLNLNEIDVELIRNYIKGQDKDIKIEQTNCGLQGMTASEQYIVMALVYADNTKNTHIVIIDRTTKEVLNVVSDYCFGHANGMAYNPNDDKFYIGFQDENENKKMASFKIDNNYSISELNITNARRYYGRITYNTDRNCFICMSGNVGYIMDDNWNEVSSFNIYPTTATQDITYYNGHIYLSTWESGSSTYQKLYDVNEKNSNLVYVYDLEGNLEETLYIPKTKVNAELEDIYMEEDGTMILAYNGPLGGPSLYKSEYLVTKTFTPTPTQEPTPSPTPTLMPTPTYAEYKVKHYVHDLGTNTYTLNATETKRGTVGDTLTLASLKKFIEGFTYVDGYLEGDTIKPTSGAVKTTTIEADGSRVINLYYRRNYLYIQYNVNGGTISSTNMHYSISNSLVEYDSNNKFLRGIYGSKIGKFNVTTYTLNETGLHKYNDPNRINIIKTGYEGKFEEQWNTTIDGKGTSFNQDISTYDANGFAGANLKTGDKTVILYLNWTPTKYTITYNLAGGTNNKSNPSNYTIETDTITLKEPAKEGYIFKGWKGSNGETAQTNVKIPKGSTDNKMYTAIWEKIENKFESNTYLIDDAKEIIISTELKENVKEFKQKIKSSENYKLVNANEKELQESDKIGTGCKIIGDNIEYTIIVKGDLNGDGNLSLNDLAQMQKVYVEITKDPIKILATDMNNSGKVEINDLAKARKEFIK